MTGKRNNIIDKTAAVEEMLQTSAAVCLCGMPGVGKKTMVRLLLEKHPEVHSIICSFEDLDPVPPEKREGKSCTWYLVRKLDKKSYPGMEEQLWDFFRKMPREDRIFFATDGGIPQELLPFVWNGVMALVYPETFWFTQAETYRYLKDEKSPLDGEEVYRFTYGWAGCIALLVKVQKQLREKWSLEELCDRYEIRSFIQNRILDCLPEEEKKMLDERAAFPRIDSELAALLWDEPYSEIEERLFMRGLMIYSSNKSHWQVQPVIRRCLRSVMNRELCLKAIRWYEEKGLIEEALECCRNMGSREEYQACLIRNYDKAAFLHFEDFYDFSQSAKEKPQLFFLHWMRSYFQQNFFVMDRELREAGVLYKSCLPQDPDKKIWREVYLNIAYANPQITLPKWMEMLEKLTQPGERLKIYDMQGESVSYLSGIRDLTELFSCNKKTAEHYKNLWRERLSEENYKGYRLAAAEYAFMIDRTKQEDWEIQSILSDITEEDPWQLRIGKLYTYYLYAEGAEGKALVEKQIGKMVGNLVKEESDICRYNTMALYYLAEAKCGEKEDIIKWLRNTGGDIANKKGKTNFHMTAQVKIHLYLGNYSQAEKILNILIPYFQRYNIWKYKAETLFQRALVEKEKGKEGETLRYAAESLQAADPYRYVRIYTGYGKKGLEVLTMYKDWLGEQETKVNRGKKQYKYGSVLKMPYADWIDYIVRKTKKNSRRYPVQKSKDEEIFRVEKLTVTEHMVLQYLEQGYTNTDIGKEMNIKLPTVKSHIYNIYKKLGVSTRIQAVQKGKEEGIL